MQIRDLTQSQIDYLDIMCNFTQDESTLFHLRARNIPLDKIAEMMNRGIDSTKQISRKVMDKIKREI